MKITANAASFASTVDEHGANNLFLKWDEKGAPLRFAILDTAYEYTSKKYGNQNLAFTVFDADTNKVKVLSISSKRFLSSLDPFTEEVGSAILQVQRRGSGQQTTFNTTKIGELTPAQLKIIEETPEIDKTKLCKG